MPYRFYFKQPSPTFYNLSKYLQQQGWRRTHFSWRAHFGEKNLHFNLAAAETLEFKHLLAQLVAQYCPHTMPETYVINDDNWSTILNEIADKYYRQPQQLLDHVDDLVWILKPSLLNNGQHIKIFTHLSQLEQHYLQSNRLGGEHVLQRYITHPHLLRGHKYSTRMFVVISNYAGAYLYPAGYVNVALLPYQPDDCTDLNSHLTNEHLSEDEANVIQIPTQEFDFFPAVYRQIASIVTDIVNALQHHFPNAFVETQPRTLAIFGFDFINDEDGRVWLLEANHGPCFPIENNHPLQHYLYADFWQAFISSFVLPIATQQAAANIEYPHFQRINIEMRHRFI
ncbi:hypothetical protein BH10PSE19_BH10PSE19_08030 [soil metagenome]